MQSEPLESLEHTAPSKKPAIFCSQAGVGSLLIVTLLVSLMFLLFGSSIKPAISNSFNSFVENSNS